MNENINTEQSHIEENNEENNQENNQENNEENNETNYVNENITFAQRTPIIPNNILRTNLTDYLLGLLYNTGLSVNSIYQDESQLQRLLNETLYTRNKFKNVISEEGLKLLKNEKFNPTDFSLHKIINNTCPITQIEFSENDSITILPCNHAFEPDAIIKWLTTEKSECPVCRYTLHSKEIRIENNDEVLSQNREQQHQQQVQEENPFETIRRVRENHTLQQLFPQQMFEHTNQNYTNYILSSLNNIIRPSYHNNDPAFETIIHSQNSRNNITTPINNILQRRSELLNSMSRIYTTPTPSPSLAPTPRIINIRTAINRRDPNSTNNAEEPPAVFIMYDNYITQNNNIDHEINDQFDIDTEEAIRRSLQE